MAGASEIRAGGAFVEVYVKDQRFRSELGKAQSAFASFSRAIQQQLARISPTAAVAFGRISAVIGRSISTFRTFSTATKSILTSVSSTISSFTRVVRRLFLGITIGAASSILIFRDWLSWADKLREIAVRTRSNIFTIAWTETGTIAAGNTLEDLGEAVEHIIRVLEDANFPTLLEQLEIPQRVVANFIQLHNSYQDALRRGVVDSVTYLTAMDRLIASINNRTQRTIVARLIFKEKFEEALKYIEQINKLTAFREFAGRFFAFDPQQMNTFVENIYRINGAFTIMKVAWRNLTTAFVANLGPVFEDWVLALASITRYSLNIVNIFRQLFPILEAIGITLTRLARAMQLMDWQAGFEAITDFIAYMRVAITGAIRVVFTILLHMMDIFTTLVKAKIIEIINEIISSLELTFNVTIGGLLRQISRPFLEMQIWLYDQRIALGEALMPESWVAPLREERRNLERILANQQGDVSNVRFPRLGTVSINIQQLYAAGSQRVVRAVDEYYQTLGNELNRMRGRTPPGMRTPFELEKAVPLPPKIVPPPVESFMGRAIENLRQNIDWESRGMFNPYAIRAAGAGSKEARRQTQLLERIAEEARRLREEFINRMPPVFD